MTRNVGNGVLEMQWTASVDPVSHYDVYIATSPTGTFSKANFKPVTGTKTKIVNLSFGLTVYAKVKAVDADGNESAFSSLAVDAVATRATAKLRFTGPVGDQVPADAMFTALVNDEIVAVRTLNGATIGG